VQVTGNENVPKYTYSLASNPNDVYSVKFDRLYETTANKAVTGNIALASLKYVFTQPMDNGNETTFNITSSTTAQFSSLRIVNHLNNRQNTSSLKFDIFVDNYVWVSNDAAAQLVISFAFTGGNRGYFTIAPTAKATSGTVAVNLVDNGGQKYITYDHFTGSLEHDPTLGISSGYISGVSSNQWMSLFLVMIVALFINL